MFLIVRAEVGKIGEAAPSRKPVRKVNERLTFLII
jgi:hypothetical protein